MATLITLLRGGDGLNAGNEQTLLGFAEFLPYIRAMKNTKLVYSTGGSEERCPRCNAEKSQCRCDTAAPIDAKKITAWLRVEKGGRKGKIVTVIDRLPGDKAWLKELTAVLKKRCGTGGTFRLGSKDGLIEIQGDKRELIRELLQERGLRVKG